MKDDIDHSEYILAKLLCCILCSLKLCSVAQVASSHT